jgi:hypothetical protein
MINKYTMILKHVYNPDIMRGGYWVKPVNTKPITKGGDTLSEMRDHFLYWRNHNELGSGNVPTIQVRKGKQVIGWFSYNGRLWEGSQDWDSNTKEIIINNKKENEK